ncbi:hypothetical protein [Virgibacillus ainsalahensis]
MEVILAAAFSAVIIFITIFSMIKILNIAYKRGEISLRKYKVFVIISIVIGIFAVIVLYYGYQIIFEAVL